jgi:hypothetical protein
MKHRSFAKFYTGDESWFYLSTNHESIWLEDGEEVPQRARKTIGSQKVMVTIFWSPRGFSVVEALPKNEKFNSKYMTDTIIPALVTANKQAPESYSEHQSYIHFDNATPHKSVVTQSVLVQNKFKVVKHPPFSPDLAPSDFYLFGTVKGKLIGETFNSADELIIAIGDILDSISQDELNRVFDEWIRRLRDCIARNGEYVMLNINRSPYITRSFDL